MKISLMNLLQVLFCSECICPSLGRYTENPGIWVLWNENDPTFWFSTLTFFPWTNSSKRYFTLPYPFFINESLLPSYILHYILLFAIYKDAVNSEDACILSVITNVTEQACFFFCCSLLKCLKQLRMFKLPGERWLCLVPITLCIAASRGAKLWLLSWSEQQTQRSEQTQAAAQQREGRRALGSVLRW